MLQKHKKVQQECKMGVTECKKGYESFLSISFGIIYQQIGWFLLLAGVIRVVGYAISL